MATGKVVWEKRDHAVNGQALAFTPDGLRLVSAGGDGSVKVWSRASGEMEREFHLADPLWSLALSPDGQSLWTAGEKGRVYRLEVLTGKRLSEPYRVPEVVKSLAVRADGQLIAAVVDDGTVRLVEAAEGFPREQSIRLFLSDAGIHALAFSPEGRHLVAAHVDGALYVLRLAEKGIVAQVPGPDPSQTEDLTGTWKVEKDELVYLDRDRVHAGFLVFGDMSWSEYTVEMEAYALDSGREVVILFHAAGLSEYVKAAFGGWNNTHHGFLHKQQRGDVLRHTGNASRGKLTANRWYQLRLEVRGSSARAYLNGTEVATCSNLPFRNGKIGVVGGGTAARFRNIKVTAPDGKVLFRGMPRLIQSEPW
jgi:hypothetical protein